MQTAERSMRSSHRLLAEQSPPQEAELEVPGSQYVCMDCSESFSSQTALTSHRQIHGGKKQFTCVQCGTGFHHQAFLQMHERNHEDPPTSPSSRVISTRSSKVADVVHVRPTFAKPGRMLNSVVKFRKEEKAERSFTPRECVTRRTHGATPTAGQRGDDYDKDHFELRISKFSDAAIHLIDTFGNSIEILTEVLDTYTIAEEDHLSAPVEEKSSVACGEPPAGISAVADGHASAAQLPLVSSAEIDATQLLMETEMTAAGSPAPEESAAAGSPAPEESAAAKSHASEKPNPYDTKSSPPIPHTLENADRQAVDLPKIPCEEAILQPPRSPEDVGDEMETCLATEERSPVAPPNEEADLQKETDLSGPIPSDNTHADQLASSLTSPEQSAPSCDRPLPAEPPGRGGEAPTCRSDVLAGEPEAAHVQSVGVVEEKIVGGEGSPHLALPPHVVQMDSQTCVPSGEASSGLSADVTTPDSATYRQAGSEEVTCDSFSDMLAIDGATSSPIESSWKERRPAEVTAARSVQDLPLPQSGQHAKTSHVDLMASQPIELQSPPAAVTVGGNPERSASSEDAAEGEGRVGSPSQQPEKREGLLAAQSDLQGADLVIADKRETDLFERDIFHLDPPVGVPIVCERGAHSTVMVHEDDNCLNGSNMKYISESEMIRLLEQDKDDAGAAEPPTANSQLFHMGQDQTFLKANLEAELCAAASDTEAPASPAKWVQKANAGNAPLRSDQSEPPSNLQDKADTVLCLPLNMQTEDNPQPQSPGESLLTEDTENITEDTSSGNVLQTVSKDSSISPAESCLPPPPSTSSVEFLDQISTEASALHQIKQPDKHPAYQDKVDVPVTPANRQDDEVSSLKLPAVPDNADTVPVNKQSEKLEYAGDRLSSHGEIDDLIPLTAPDEEPQVSSFQEKMLMQKTLPPAMDLLPSGVLHDQQSTRTYGSDKQTHAASSGSTEMSNKGLVTKKNEDESDSSSTQKDLQRKVKANELQGNLYVAGTQSSQCTEISTANRDLEASENVSLGMVDNLEKSRPEDEVENVSLANKDIPYMSSSSINPPICQDDVQASLEDSELMEEEHEDITANLKTRERPLGAGAECLKCGRRIRRSRKEMVWSSICFKCRLIAKRKERLSNQSDSSEFPVERYVSGKEQEPSAKVSDLHIKRERDRVKDTSNVRTLHLDPATRTATKKMYKCPKCEETFRIPKLLAGHMKCHTLPQCLTCGCPIPLKYKTKRIPRRCQKCIQQLREGKGTAKESADHQSEMSDNEDLSFSAADVPDVSSENAVVKKGKRKPHLGKALDEEEMDSLLDKETTEKQDEDFSEELDVTVDGESSRVCPQCGKPFKCNRSLNLHLLSHKTAQCESCGCRLQKKRRAGRWSKKCRICKLQSKDQMSRETEDQAALSGDKSTKPLKAKQGVVSQKRKMQSIFKQKKELKWKNMLLAVKKLMNKSRKRKETAAQNVDPEKKSEESLKAEKCEASSINENKTSIGKDTPQPEPPLADRPEAGSSGIKCVPTKTAKQGRKCLYKEKNIIKVEEEDILPCTPDLAVPNSPAFIKEEEAWQCLECSQNTENLEALLSHQQSHIDGLSFTCPQCPQVFSSEEYMNSHIPSHDEKRPFHCPECDKTFTKRNHLGVHLRVHSGSRPFACPDCPRRFRQKATLLAHRYSHRNFELLLPKPYQCSTCHKSFKQKERLVVHERLHTGECPFSCKNCDQVFPSKARLNVHRKLHKLEKAAVSSEQQVSCKEEDGSFHCQDCTKICSTKASLALHRRVHKLPSEQDTEAHTFHCKDCDKDFASKATLSVHLKNHSAHKVDAEANPDLKQPFPCKDCDKVCLSKASLVLHRKVHQSLSASEQNLEIKVKDRTPGFTCKDCAKVCATKASLVLHSKVHKSPSGQEQTPDGAKVLSFRCKKCSMIFSTKTSFVLHKKMHKPASRIQKNPKDVAKPRLFRCKLCDMVFSTKACLFLHRKEHKTTSVGEENPKTDGEPQTFSCKDCDKIYSTKASLAFHSKVHKMTLDGEENPEIDAEGSFVCKDCDKVCSTKASYVLHRKVHRSSSSERNPNPKGDQEKSFLCKECGRTFTSKGRLSFHRFKKHGLSPKGDQTLADETTEDQPKKVSEDKLFSCSICGLRFTKLKMLVQHKAVHGDRTATPCTHCGKRFLYKKSLFNHMKICQGKTKGKKLALLKKASAKRKIPREGSGSGAEEEVAQKKCKTEEKKKSVNVAHKLKVKNQLEKAKKAKKEKGKAKTEPKPKEKRPKADGEAAPEDEGKKSAPEKPSDAKPEKPTDPALKEQSRKEKNTGKIKRVRKETPKEKKVGSSKKWRVMAAATVKKKKLQSVIIGGKKKLLVKKRRVPLKPKPGAKSSQSTKEN